MDKRAPLSPGQLLAFLVFLPLIIMWVMEKFSLIGG